jgi:hypothetical protein
MFDLTPKMGFAGATQLTHYPATLHNYKATRPCEASLPPDLGVKQAKGLSFTAGGGSTHLSVVLGLGTELISKKLAPKKDNNRAKEKFQEPHDTSSPVADCYLRQFARPSYLGW